MASRVGNFLNNTVAPVLGGAAKSFQQGVGIAGAGLLSIPQAYYNYYFGDPTKTFSVTNTSAFQGAKTAFNNPAGFAPQVGPKPLVSSTPPAPALAPTNTPTTSPLSTNPQTSPTPGISPGQVVNFGDSSYQVGPNGEFNPVASTNSANNIAGSFPVAGTAQDVQSANLTSGAAPVSTTPSPSTDTSTLASQPTTQNDIQSLLTQNIQRSQDLFNNLLSFYNNPVTPEMQGAFDQYNKATSALEQDQLNSANQQMALGVQAGVPTSVATAQQNEAARQTQFREASLSLQQQAALRTLQFQQSSQSQRLDAAKLLYQVNQDNFNNSLNLYEKTAPQAIGQPIVDAQGNATLPMRNPVTGKISLTPIGNVGPVAKQVDVTKIGQHYDQFSGQMVDDYGLINKSTGTITPLSGAQGAGQTFGLMPDGSTTPFTPSGTTRTDRNNNFIAASVALNPNGSLNTNDPTTKQWTDALTQAGVPFQIEQGQNFGNRATIQFPNAQAGLMGADTLLQTSAFSWYKKHTGADVLQGINTPQQYAALPEAQRLNIIQGIYKNENGAPGNLMSAFNGPQQLTSDDVRSIAPIGVRGAIDSTSDGRFYIDMGKLSTEASKSQADAFYAYARAQGLPISKITGDQASALKNVEDANQQITTAVGEILPYLSGSGVGNIPTGIWNKITGIFQTEGRGTTIASYGSFRNAAISTLRAAAGSQGLRINQAEILMSVANDLPTEFDTTATAQQKLHNIQSQLQAVRDSLLGDNSKVASNNNDPLGILP